MESEESEVLNVTKFLPDHPGGELAILKNLSEVRMLAPFYLAKNDHRWVSSISLKTINAQVSLPS